MKAMLLQLKAEKKFSYLHDKLDVTKGQPHMIT
jgi:hypothetical protein